MVVDLPTLILASLFALMFTGLHSESPLIYLPIVNTPHEEVRSPQTIENLFWLHNSYEM